MLAVWGSSINVRENLIRMSNTTLLSSINLPVVFRLKLMTLDASDNGLLTIDCFRINLKQIEEERLIINTMQKVTDKMQSRKADLQCKLHWDSAP